MTGPNQMIFQQNFSAALAASIATGLTLYGISDAVIYDWGKKENKIDETVSFRLQVGAGLGSIASSFVLAYNPQFLDEIFKEGRLYSAVTLMVIKFGHSLITDVDNILDFLRHAAGGFIFGFGVYSLFPNRMTELWSERKTNSLDVLATTAKTLFLAQGIKLMIKPSKEAKKFLGGILVGIGFFYAMPQSFRDALKI